MIKRLNSLNVQELSRNNVIERLIFLNVHEMSRIFCCKEYNVKML